MENGIDRNHFGTDVLEFLLKKIKLVQKECFVFNLENINN